MQEEFIELREPTPLLHSKRCRVISLLLRLFLQYGSAAATLSAWYLYDFFIALLTLVLAFILIGIIRSKLRNSVIPPSQREYQYNDKEIADWFSAKELCYETHESL
ncbi:MAG: hypothetical protein RQ763_00405 [Sulfurimonas sp.]|uniref:hypothetical protein n=1 Tax=Sulfurimonas sp. TaxID=2022749 RepID=UPI0028CCBFB3|nr:hypothetical protein [Sulfurimonas sp.]MDT8337635.1 hypothetical protein [Sulfurimonas sp.]